MKRKLQFTLVTIASLIYGQTINAQTITYNFENVTAPTTTITGLTILDGTQQVVSASSLGFTGNTTNVLHASVSGSNGDTVSDLTNFPTTAADCSVTWTEYHTVTPPAQLKKGVLLRGTGLSTYQVGIKTGYFFIVQNETNGTVTFRIATLDGTAGFTNIVRNDGVAAGFAVNAPMYYRASAIGLKLTLEYSTDGITFTEGTSITVNATGAFTAAGATQLITGIGYYSPDYYYDNITYRAGASLGIPSVSLNEKSFSVFKKDNTISITSTDTTIKSVKLFDVNGRVIATKNNVDASETSFSNQTFAKGLILVQITGTNDKVATIKLVN